MAVQKVQRSLDAVTEEMAYDMKLLERKRAWAGHTFKLMQVMLTAPEATAPASCTGRLFLQGLLKSAASQASPAEPLLRGLLESAASHVGSLPHKGSVQQSSLSPVLSTARLQQLLAALRSTGAAHFKVPTQQSKSSSGGHEPSDGSSDKGQHDDGCLHHPYIRMSPLYTMYMMTTPDLSEAAARLEHETELDAKSVKQFFLRVRPVCDTPG